MTDKLEDLPAFQQHSRTSRGAAQDAKTFASTVRGQILDWIWSRKDQGATDEEGITAMGIGSSTYRPRRIELVAMGLVEDSGETRLTRANRKAVVWKAVRRK